MADVTAYEPGQFCWTDLATTDPVGAKRQLHDRIADQIGLTPAGLRENGWAIAQDEVGAKRADTAKPKKRASSRDRMKVVGGAG